MPAGPYATSDVRHAPAVTRRARLTDLAGLGCLGTLVLWRTWGTWPDVLVDFGLQLYVPWQLAAS